ncbi:MAG: hypothetical protein JWN44_6089 [Myxococcales bacterium]|nr:hypothetical protein [Myxococcales bacterium]
MWNAKRGALITACAGTLFVAAFGCGPSLPDKIGFAGQNAALQSGTQVNFQDAFVAEGIFKVKLWVQNLSQAFMIVDRDGFALRLPDGRVLRRAVGTFTQHTPYNIPPGGGHEVFVDFRDPGKDMRIINAASLIVGGISFSTDPRPRVVGEIPLVPTGAR